MARRRPRPEGPLTPIRTSAFKKDWKVQERRGKDMDKLRAIILALIGRERLEARHVDHALSGKLKGWRDCHVEPDWVLFYRVVGSELILGRTGSHSDLLG